MWDLQRCFLWEQQCRDTKPTTRTVRERAWETFSPPQQLCYKRKGCFDGRMAISNKGRREGTHQSPEPRARAKRGRISISCRWFPPLHPFGEALPALHAPFRRYSLNLLLLLRQKSCSHGGEKVWNAPEKPMPGAVVSAGIHPMLHVTNF